MTAQQEFIQPIPTYFEGITFRSRLEARWAVLFHHAGLDWEYEPLTFQFNKSKLSYTIDFKVSRDLLEVKPKKPTPKYLELMGLIQDACKHDPEHRKSTIFLAYGSFYNEVPRIKNIRTGRLLPSPLALLFSLGWNGRATHGICPQVMAANYRFDLS